MSRFVRASKYRHVYGQAAKKEHGFENVKVTNSAWDTNIIAASAKYISVNWNASGGGAFAILPLPSPFAAISTPAGFPSKLPDTLPLARSHTAPVLDTDWSPHDDSLVASSAEDGKVLLWQVSPDVFEGWGAEGWAPVDFDPVLRIDASPRKVGQVMFHPSAKHVLASASGEHTVKLWDLARPEDARSVLGGHGDLIQSMAFNPTGTLLATTCRDRKLRIFDPRAGGDAVRTTDGHGGIKGSRVVWMGELDKIATTGFSKMSDRQVGIWETGGLGNVKTMSLDQSAGVVMPFWTDNQILFLAGKGDGNIRYYEYESDSLFALDEHKTSEPQRGMCFLPRRALNVAECEIARAYKVHGGSIEPIGFRVPRKSDSFQSDIFPPAPSSEPALSAPEFFNGKDAPRKLVSLADGSPVTGSSSSAAPASYSTTAAYTAVPANLDTSALKTPVASTPKTPMTSTPLVSTPTTTTMSAPPPAPAPAPVEPSPPTPVVQRPSASREESSGAGSDELRAQNAHLQSENARLSSELREAREKLRNLELQVESMRANARKAQALLESAHGA